jgi:hypothetical protein
MDISPHWAGRVRDIPFVFENINDRRFCAY